MSDQPGKVIKLTNAPKEELSLSVGSSAWVENFEKQAQSLINFEWHQQSEELSTAKISSLDALRTEAKEVTKKTNAQKDIPKDNVTRFPSKGCES